jgi:hypothetical protein
MSQSNDAFLKMVDATKYAVGSGYQPTVSRTDPDDPPRGISGVPSLAPVETSLQALRCPNCGAPLNVKGRAPYNCDYCHCTIVVGGYVPPRPAEHVVLLKPDENLPMGTILA